MLRSLLLLALTGCSSSVAGDPTPPTAAAAPSEETSLYELALTALDGSPFDATSLKGKAVLFVNVASKCGFTPQYEGLQALWSKYQERGLVVVGVPCNQFGGQEPGSSEQIASFCKMNYGVDFPLLEKQDVNGPQRSPLYATLVDSPAGGGARVKWNFEKFVVSPTGEIVARFPSGTKPDDKALTDAIEKVLPTKG